MLEWGEVVVGLDHAPKVSCGRIKTLDIALKLGLDPTRAFDVHFGAKKLDDYAFDLKPWSRNGTSVRLNRLDAGSPWFMEFTDFSKLTANPGQLTRPTRVLWHCIPLEMDDGRLVLAPLGIVRLNRLEPWCGIP
jgi:hypothetical protein